MATDRTDKFSKIILGGFGFLISIIGYFLVSRDTEFKSSISRLWTEITASRNAEYTANIELEKLKGESHQRDETLKWIIQANQDREQRIRALEEKCRK